MKAAKLGRKTTAERLKVMCRSYFVHKRFGCFEEVGVTAWGKRRADFVALKISGEIVIVEIKSCLADFKADSKWEHYREHCNRFYFCFPHPLPVELPPGVGILIPGNNGYLRVSRKASSTVMPPGNRRSLVMRLAWRAATWSKRTNPRRVRVFLDKE